MTSNWIRQPSRGAGVRSTGSPPWRALALLPLLATLGWAGVRAVPTLSVGRGTPPIELGPPLPCPSGPRLVIPVLDASSSVIDQGGADPRGRSFDEASAVADHLAATPCTDDDRFGVITFASTAVELEPARLTSLSIITGALRRPPDDELGGGTDLTSAIRLTTAMVSRFPDHTATVIVLSDMRADDVTTLGPALHQLSQVASIHLIALGDHETTFDDRFTTVTTLHDVASGQIARALADGISRDAT